MKYIKYFENINIREEKVEKIKLLLLDANECDSWNTFIDSQVLGDCQLIVSDIVSYNIPGVVAIFGHIKLNEDIYSIDEGDYIDKMTHHWAEIDGEIEEFSKGTLKNYIVFNNLYETWCEDDYIYEKI